MKTLYVLLAVCWTILAGVFVSGKLRNDGSIAKDTARVADSIDKALDIRWDYIPKDMCRALEPSAASEYRRFVAVCDKGYGRMDDAPIQSKP